PATSPKKQISPTGSKAHQNVRLIATRANLPNRQLSNKLNAPKGLSATLPMCLQECRPCRPLASLGRWLDAAALQYIGHSPTTNTVAEVGQRPLNPRVSPTRIVLGHAQNQSGDPLHDPGPPRPMPV